MNLTPTVKLLRKVSDLLEAGLEAHKYEHDADTLVDLLGIGEWSVLVFEINQELDRIKSAAERK